MGKGRKARRRILGHSGGHLTSSSPPKLQNEILSENTKESHTHTHLVMGKEDRHLGGGGGFISARAEQLVVLCASWFNGHPMLRTHKNQIMSSPYSTAQEEDR